MANQTTIYIEKDSLDWTAPFGYSTTYVNNSFSGYWRGKDLDLDWTGNNLTYTDGYSTPTGGTLKSISVYHTDQSLIYSMSTNYVIQHTDASTFTWALFGAAINAGDVDWFGSKYDDKFYFYSKDGAVKNTFDGLGGTDSFNLSYESKDYIFTNYNAAKGSVTISSTHGVASATLRSIEQFVFSDKTLTFSQLADIATVSDTTSPVVSSFISSDLAINGNLDITFNEAIKSTVGTVYLYDARAKLIEVFDLASASNVSVSGSTITINPTKDFTYNSSYSLYLYGVQDIAGNTIVSTSENFTTTNTVTTASAYYVLSKTPDNLTYSGSADFTGIGNKNANTIQGGIGNDKLNGLAGADRLIGKAGDDTYTIDNTGDVVTENSNEGTDIVWVTIAKAGGVYTLTTNVENGYLLNKVAYSLNGNGLDNILVGNASANVLNGGTADDSIYGKLGKDTLIGGAGADGFYFDTKISSSNIDTINDFQSGQGGDHIHLDSLIFTSLSSTGYGADNFVVGAKALDTNDYLIFNPVTHTLSYDADGSGAGKAVAFVVLTGVTNLDVNDIAVY
jgi:Ca2+-binding RTX toxin-like protein